MKILLFNVCTSPHTIQHGVALCNCSHFSPLFFFFFPRGLSEFPIEINLFAPAFRGLLGFLNSIVIRKWPVSCLRGYRTDASGYPDLTLCAQIYTSGPLPLMLAACSAQIMEQSPSALSSGFCSNVT